MTPAVLDRPTLFGGGASAPAARRARTTTPAAPAAAPASAVASAPRSRLADGGPTLEGVIAGAWEGLAAHRGVGCPICGGHMTPRYGAAGMSPVGGRCTSCGTTLG